VGCCRRGGGGTSSRPVDLGAEPAVQHGGAPWQRWVRRLFRCGGTAWWRCRHSCRSCLGSGELVPPCWHLLVPPDPPSRPCQALRPRNSRPLAPDSIAVANGEGRQPGTPAAAPRGKVSFLGRLRRHSEAGRRRGGGGTWALRPHGASPCRVQRRRRGAIIGWDPQRRVGQGFAVPSNGCFGRPVLAMGTSIVAHRRGSIREGPVRQIFLPNFRRRTLLRRGPLARRFQ